MTQTIGKRYEVGRLIGEGAMGEVYWGQDSQTNEPVAIKALKSGIANADMITRFEREAEALRQLNHPNIVKGLANFEEHGQHFLIMEYVGGGSLQQLMYKQPQMGVHQVLRIGLEIADALTRAHLLNIIHRDLKPANILLAEDGTPRLTDFGIASLGTENRVTAPGTIIGTLDYLSPEACRGEVVDHRSDIWSFGVMLYEMLAGQVPFKGNNLGEIIYHILNTPLPDINKIRDDVPPDLLTLIEKMLEKNVEARLNSVRIVGADLEAILRGEKTTTSTMRPISQTFILGNNTTTLGVNLATSHIPPQSTPFVGRKTELEEIHTLLQNPDCRHITLLGPGGMGKTRLSIEVAGEQRDIHREFSDGVFFVGLAPLNHKEEIITAIAETIQFSFFGAEAPLTQLLNYLREKQMLLVLDNFEHLTNCTAIVSDILNAAPALKIITTSREKLNLRGEWVFQVEPMSFPDYKSPEDLLQYGAIQLFMQSARRARPDFTLTESNQDTVVEIVQLVQGSPLGIELAAAWLEMLNPSEIVDEMRTSFDFLETDLRDVPERHRSIRAVFDYSWNLMNEDERSAFSKLSIFKGGFTREAAAVVTGAMLRPLTTLVNKSLLRRLPSGRYEVHELLRQYAAEKLGEDAEIETAIIESHCDYYLDFVAAHSFENIPYREWLNTLSDELENIRAALKYAFTHQRGDKLRAMLPIMHWFYESRSLFMEAHETYQTLVALYKGNQDYSPLYLVVLNRLGIIHLRLGKFLEAQAELEETLLLARKLDDQAEEALSLTWLSYAAMSVGDYDAALDLGQQALARSEGLPLTLLGTTKGHLGYIYFLRGDYDTAEQLMRDSSELAEVNGNIFYLGFMYNNLGEVYRSKGDFRQAKSLFETAYNFFSEIGYLRGMSFTINNLGGITQGMGDMEATESMYRRSYRLSKQIGDRVGVGHALSALGNIAYLQGKVEESIEFYQQALRLRREMNDRRGVADSLDDLGYALSQVGAYEQAEAVLLESKTLSQEIGDPWGEARNNIYLCELELWRGDLAQARVYAEAGLRVGEQFNNGFGIGWGKANIALLDALEGQPQRVLDGLIPYSPNVENSEFQWLLALGNTVISLAYLGLGQDEVADQLLRRSLQVALETNNADTLLSALAVLGQAFAQQGDFEAALRAVYPAIRREGQAIPIIAYMVGNRVLAQVEDQLPPPTIDRLRQEALLMTPQATAHQILSSVSNPQGS